MVPAPSGCFEAAPAAAITVAVGSEAAAAGMTAGAMTRDEDVTPGAPTLTLETAASADGSTVVPLLAPSSFTTA